MNEIKFLHPSDRKTSMSLTDADRALILKTKNANSELRHRQIQEFLQNGGKYYSASSIYWELKNNNLVGNIKNSTFENPRDNIKKIG